MTETTGYLEQFVAEYRNDPGYVAEGVAIDIMEQALSLMLEKGLTEDELAAAMGISRRRLIRLLNAPPTLTLTDIARLAVGLDAKMQVSLVKRRAP